MPSPGKARLLFVHAHPDDESITTGGTIAHYASLGAAVYVVTCTLGEEGEVIGERYAQLTVDHADQLGGYRIGELTAALRALGGQGPILLGGAGRWRDSGMAGTPRRHRQRFIDADPREAVGALVAIIRRLRPHIVVTYDPDGGYGHPDHIQTHRITTAAVAASGGDDHPGAGWQVPKLYWTVSATSAMGTGLAGLQDLPGHWTRESVDDIGFGYPDERIDAAIDIAASLPAKVSALRAHATQVSVGPGGASFALSNNIALPILAEEYYILASGRPGSRDTRGWETDLLAGVDLE